MRVYFEKPRTTVGWKGLINDPHLDDSFPHREGLSSRASCCCVSPNWGMPAGTEALDPIMPQYLSDLITWTRHRRAHHRIADSPRNGERPVDSGGLQERHRRRPWWQLTRCSRSRHPHQLPRHHTSTAASAMSARAATARPRRAARRRRPATTMPSDRRWRNGSWPAAGRRPPSSSIAVTAIPTKTPRRSRWCSRTASRRSCDGNRSIVGLMLESPFEGGQSIPKDLSKLEYGVSITDPCIDWETTENPAAGAGRARAGTRCPRGLRLRASSSYRHSSPRRMPSARPLACASPKTPKPSTTTPAATRTARRAAHARRCAAARPAASRFGAVPSPRRASRAPRHRGCRRKPPPLARRRPGRRAANPRRCPA